MGLALEFLMGDVSSILRAYAEEEFELLEEPGVVDELADLSLHIDPSDLDRLSIGMSKYSGLPASTLRPHLELQVDEPAHGALTVSASWAEYAAAVPLSHLRALVEDWHAQMATDWNEPDIEMVGQFLALCGPARKEDRTLVHTWIG